VEARRAVAMALDRNALSVIYAGLSRPAIQLVPPGMLGHDESVVEFAPLDVAAARKAVADARISTPVNVDLLYPALPTAAYPDPQRVAQLIAADLSKIGVVARLRAADPVALRERRGALTLDTTLSGLDPDDTFWPLLGPPPDQRADSLAVGLLRRARSEADASKRGELYKQVSKISRTEALRIPLVFADVASAASARLVGLNTGVGIEYFGTLWLRA
jgi:ABC-type transport system substrate-binding protein